jgi:hypothetical protein
MEQDETTEIFDEAMSQEDAKEASEGNLVPKGRWPGQVVDFTRKVLETEGGEHPLEGKPVYRVHIELQTDEGAKHFFLDACPVVVKATSKKGGTYMRAESEAAAAFYAATKMYGKPFQTVLAWGQEHILVYNIGIKKATDDYKAANQLKGIATPKDGE